MTVSCSVQAPSGCADKAETVTVQQQLERSQVAQMFHGRSVFITGASGFIGRVLVEKLLRTYVGIERVYLLMRTKKNAEPGERLHKHLLSAPIFDRIRRESPELFDKLHVVPGDISQPQLGVSQEQMRALTEDKTLSIVFHSAATIKFDEPLKVSATLNLRATREIIEFARSLPNLLCLCHVSTAYVNSDIRNDDLIEERIYPMPGKHDDFNKLIQLAEIMDENLLQSLKPQFVTNRPNTYTYTKALAEHLIAQEARDLPVAIVRPSIVTAAWREPLPGWVDNLNGPTGLLLAIGKGLLRSLHVKLDAKAEIIPVDVCVNTMIAAAFYAAKTNNKLKSTNETTATTTTTTTASINNNNERVASSEQDEQQQQAAKTIEPWPPVVHCNSGSTNRIRWTDMEGFCFPIIRNYPSAQVFRYPFGTFKSSRLYDAITRFFVHLLPAIMVDLLCRATGKQPQLTKIYGKLDQAVKALDHFATTNYNFASKNFRVLEAHLNEHDRRELFLDVTNLDWHQYWHDYVLGARRYVLREKDETLDEARKSFKKAYYIEMAYRCLLVLALSSLVYYLAPLSLIGF